MEMLFISSYLGCLTYLDATVWNGVPLRSDVYLEGGDVYLEGGDVYLERRAATVCLAWLAHRCRLVHRLSCHSERWFQFGAFAW